MSMEDLEAIFTMGEWLIGNVNDDDVSSWPWWTGEALKVLGAASPSEMPFIYAGGIPLDVVERHLSKVHVVAVNPTFTSPADPSKVIALGRRAMVDIYTDTVYYVEQGMGARGESYGISQYRETLLDDVSAILDISAGEFDVRSVLFLENRGLASISLAAPESVTGPGGVEYVPFLHAAKSHTGKVAKEWTAGTILRVCDNTTYMSREEGRKSGRIHTQKHTKNATLNIAAARENLRLEFARDETDAQLESLLSWSVSDAEWSKVLDSLAPAPEVGAKGRGATMAGNKRDALATCYTGDARVTPWKGTAFGVLQAVNTYQTHYAQVNGTHRAERNAVNVAMGAVRKSDAETLALVAKATGRALVAV